MQRNWKRHWKILIVLAISSLSGVLLGGSVLIPVRSIKIETSSPNNSILRSPVFPLSRRDHDKFVTIQTRFQRQQWQKLDFGDRLQNVAQEFLGDAYRANLLDQSITEQPFVSLHEFDCVLFLETVLAVTAALSSTSDLAIDVTLQPKPAIEANLFQEIQRYRYRDGKLDNYCHRLHYFSDWVLDNQQRGLVKDIGTVPLNRSLTFISQNWRKYSPIVKNPSLKDCIKTTESAISQKLQSGQLNYIPIENLRSQETKLRSGDLIGLVTDLNGLDVTHSGFLYRKGSQAPAGLLHASQRSGIKISPDLEGYVRGVDGAIGIIVARPIEQSSAPKLGGFDRQ